MAVQLVAGVSALTPHLGELADPLFIGNGAAALPASLRVYRSAETDLPHARWTAFAAVDAVPAASVRPLYVRDAGAVMPRLARNPLTPPE
jgi:hypothetical protein